MQDLAKKHKLKVVEGETEHSFRLFGDYSLYYRPDIVIAQFGICDCAPRYINDNKPIWLGLKVIFKKFHLESFFWRTIKIFFKRSSKCVYVPFDEFTKNVFEYVEILKGIESVKKIIFISNIH